MLKKVSRNTMAFTVIELITVMALLGILFAMATPNFIESEKKSNELSIQNNIMVLESKTKEVMRLDRGIIEDWTLTKSDIPLDKVYSNSGIMENFTFEEDKEPYLRIPDKIVQETIMQDIKEGIYFADNNGDVFHVNLK